MDSMTNDILKTHIPDKQHNTSIDQMEEEIRQLKTACEQLRAEVDEAENEIGRVLAEVGKGSSADDDTLEGSLLVNSEEWMTDYADDNGFTFQGNSKEEWAHELAQYMLLPSHMRQELFWYSEEQMDAFERLRRSGCIVPTSEDKELLKEFWDNGYAIVYDDDFYQIPTDLGLVYDYIIRKGYRELHRKVSWTLTCLAVFEWIYLAAPVKILHQMYRREPSLRVSYQDFLQILEQIPEKVNPCRLIDGIIFSKEYASLCSWQTFDELMFDADYYIPTKEEILDMKRNSYPASKKAYQELWHFSNSVLGTSPENCSKLCAMIFRAVFEIGILQDIKHLSGDYQINFSSEKIAIEFSEIIQKVNANTRLASLRGHTITELMSTGFSPVDGAIPVISGYGKDVAVLLEDSRLQVKPDVAGIKMDPKIQLYRTIKEKKNNNRKNNSTNSDSDYNNRRSVEKTVTVAKRIYPNALCPCGSGKKYKYCCGKGK